MAKQRITTGSIFEIRIDNNYFIYGQILNNAGYAFFNYKTEEPISNISLLNDKPILFIISVYNDAINSGRWKVIGKLDIRQDLKKQPMKFIQDSLNPQLFEIYDPNTGKSKQSNKNEVIGLECAAVWEAEHVEDRIRDFYNGVENEWVKQLSIK